MKKFTHALLVINVMTFSWLMISARSELPPWKKAFDDVKLSINNLDLTGEMATFNQSVLHSRVSNAETFARITIDEYRRSDGALGVLTIINIIGIATIVLKNERRTRRIMHGG